MTVETANAWVILLAGLAGLIAALWKGFSIIRRTLDRIEGLAQKELTTNGGSSLIDKVNALHTQVGTVTADVSSVDKKVSGVRIDLTNQHEELTKHIEDVQSKAGRLARDAEMTAAAWVKYVFEHRDDHTDLHRWLASEFGVDRRDAESDAVDGPAGLERRGD